MTFDDTPGEYFVSTDKALLDTFFIIRELKATYWGGWLTPATVMRAIDHSLCFGLYVREPDPTAAVQQRQIGFARVITDYATFAWICDVFVTDRYRAKGLATFMMNVVLGHPEVKPRSCLLCTKDAQGLYRKFGFEKFEAMKRQGGL